MQPHATGCVRLRLRLCSCVEIFEPVSVRLCPKKAKDQTLKHYSQFICLAVQLSSWFPVPGLCIHTRSVLPQVYPCNLHIDIPLGNFITYLCADPDPQINTCTETQTRCVGIGISQVQVRVALPIPTGYPCSCLSGSGGLTDDFLHVSNCICVYCNAVCVYPHVQRACTASGLNLIVCRLSLRFDR